MMVRYRRFLDWRIDGRLWLKRARRDIRVRSRHTLPMRHLHGMRCYLSKRIIDLCSAIATFDADMRYTMPVIADAILQSKWGRRAP
jgi:hypothetical protein